MTYAHCQGLMGIIKVLVAADDDEIKGVIDLHCFLDQFQAGEPGHPDIGYDNIRAQLP
jgi:hypothetical protein